MTTRSTFRFQLYAQNRNETVIFRNNEQNNFTIQTATDILTNQQLMENFSQEDQAIIKAIASDNNYETENF